MARKKRGNDAIPSWSEFNYQGKIMLLEVLTKINASISSDTIASYSVELEIREDFVILCAGRPESFHQVKATLSKSKWSSHSEAMDKLLLHRNSSDNNLAHCYFVVAKEISDWNDTSNIGQIILSTHEDQKARLLRFKFQQADLSVCEHNMQQIYFSAVQ